MKYWLGILLGALLVATLVSQGSASANVNDFRISSFDIEYKLGRGDDGRSKLHTLETIKAKFPFRNQNRGIERAIPVSFNNRNLPLTINSITDDNGWAYKYSEIASWGVKVLRIGDPNRYVHGLNEYNIDYSQEHVTRFFEDTDRTEWYWDTNGTGWKVPIDELNVRVSIDQAVVSSMEGDPQCYIGASGSTQRCELVGSDGQYSVSAAGLKAGENVTLAFGFKPGTFSEYQPSLWESVVFAWIILTVITSLLGIVIIIYLFVMYARKNNRTKEVNPVAVEYIPPRDASVMVASQVYAPRQGSRSAFSAQLIDLAVRRYIKIVETSPKRVILLADYDVVIAKDLGGLRSEELEILDDMFGKRPAVGDRVSLSSLRDDTKYVRRLSDNFRKLNSLVTGSYDIRSKDPKASAYFKTWFVWLILAAFFTLSPVLLVASIVAIASSAMIRPLTDKGLALRRYMLGFERYIKASESERLAFLQGPDTAEKIGESVDVNNKGQVLKLYERALPYAVLYGHEKEWVKRLGEFYQEMQAEPDWYTGKTAFNAAVFGSAISSFSQSAVSYSSHSSSSSSGGSSGGGFSGGGGGGGGGGGW